MSTGVANEKYNGFGGWLILFAIFLALFFPLLAAGEVISRFVSMGRYFDPFPGLLAVFMIDLIMKVAVFQNIQEGCCHLRPI